jgi:hypothetical protein
VRYILLIALVLVILQLPIGTVQASTSADVTITVTPQVVSISCAPLTFAIGMVDASSVHWAKNDLIEPSWPLTEGNCTYVITNNGLVNVDVDIRGADLIAGAGKTLTLAAAIGGDTYALKAGSSGTANLAAMLQVNKVAGQEMISNLDYHAGNNTQGFELVFYAPTVFSFADMASGTITLTAREP